MELIKVENFIKISNNFKISNKLKASENIAFFNICRIRQSELVSKVTNNGEAQIENNIVLSQKKLFPLRKIDRMKVDSTLECINNILEAYGEIFNSFEYSDKKLYIEFNMEKFEEYFMIKDNFYMLPLELLKNIKSSIHIVILSEILKKSNFRGNSFILLRALRELLGKGDNISRNTFMRDIKRAFLVINKIKLLIDNNIKINCEIGGTKLHIKPNKLFTFYADGVDEEDTKLESSEEEIKVVDLVKNNRDKQIQKRRKNKKQPTCEATDEEISMYVCDYE